MHMKFFQKEGNDLSSAFPNTVQYSSSLRWSLSGRSLCHIHFMTLINEASVFQNVIDSHESITPMKVNNRFFLSQKVLVD